MSFCTMPISPVNSAVVAPITSTNDSAAEDISYSGDIRATMKMPAVTMFAAWISAEIGVGPSIESGSHTCSGTCADLPIAPMNSNPTISVASDHGSPDTTSMVRPCSDPAFANTVPEVSVLNAYSTQA